MPKLKDHAVEENQKKIEQAALRVFTRQGYHGTSVREIADQAKVSLGNIYNYYPTKEELFVSLVRRYDRRMMALQRRKLTPLIGSLDPQNLVRLAAAVRDIIYNEPDYWRLMYIDVVEFGNVHFAHIFRDLARNIRVLGGKKFEKRVGDSADQSLAFTAIYLQFFTYYLVEKLFGGKQHLGFPDEEAIPQLIQIFTTGISPMAKKGNVGRNGSGKGANGKPRSSRRRKP